MISDAGTALGRVLADLCNCLNPEAIVLGGEVPRLPGEDPRDRRIREALYLGLTHWLPLLLDRKDRLSMATGLEVRVPFCDHRLVDYVWNVPWAMKETGGIEKGQLRDLLARPDAPLFSLIDHAKLTAAYAADPALAGTQAVQPSSTTPAAFLLDINEWLRRYDVRVL